ncbi:MAG TPA: hypothetical protein VLY63_04615 [Anaerolineae bacterium]|nr:hypothetical protein [Anaerolineae bacterium]
MTKKTWCKMLLLVAVLTVVGCAGTLEISLEDGSETEGSEGVDSDATLGVTPIGSPTAGATATRVELTITPTPEPTVEATSSPTALPTATPTVTPTTPPTPPSTPTATQPPTPTSTVPAPEISAFAVRPAEARPGETVTLTWQASGDRATICPTARYILFTSDNCWQVPVSGATTFTIPPEAAGFQSVDLILKVERLQPAASVTGQASVALKCDGKWFFSDARQAGICPREPHRTYAAAQRFQHGTMVWLEEPGRYYILADAPLHDGTDRKRLDIITDPLDIIRDTSSEIEAPPSLYAPVSGFGLVWRGDITQSPGYRQQLGWALEPEFGYQAVLQCDDARPSGGRSWQTCYLKGPDGEIITLHPLGGWQFWGGF